MAELWANEIKKGTYKVKLNVEVAAGDYEAWFSAYGNYVSYVVRYEATQQDSKDAWKKMHRTIFSLTGGTKVVEENVEAPTLLQSIPDGQTIPEDPLAFLFSSYLKEIPDPPEPAPKPTKCERKYWGKPFHVWYKAKKRVIYVDPDQRIAPPNTPTGTPKEEDDRKLKNWIKQNDCKGDLKAKWQEWAVTDKTNDSNEAICEDGTKKDSFIELNKLEIPDDELEFTTVVSLGIYKKWFLIRNFLAGEIFANILSLAR